MLRIYTDFLLPHASSDEAVNDLYVIRSKPGECFTAVAVGGSRDRSAPPESCA